MKLTLQDTPLFQMLPAEEVDRLQQLAEVKYFQRGDVVFTEGEPATTVWIVKQGWVHLVKRNPHGMPTTIFTMTPDEALCGISAFDRGAYAAGAAAATDTQMIKIPAEVFGDLLIRYPLFMREVLASCCVRMHHMAETISMAQAPVRDRVITVLLRLRASFGDTVPVTHQELSQMAGTRLETSIRTVAALKRRGCLSTARGKLTIVRPDKLHDLLHASNRRI